MRVTDPLPDVKRQRRRRTFCRIAAVIGFAIVASALFAGAGRWPWLAAGIASDPTRAAAALIFAGTYLVIAIGKLPGFYLDRAGAALLGASLMIGLGVLSLDEALRRSTSARSRCCSA